MVNSSSRWFSLSKMPISIPGIANPWLIKSMSPRLIVVKSKSIPDFSWFKSISG